MRLGVLSRTTRRTLHMANILVVEDFDDSRFSLCRLLEMSGHHVLEATGGREAVDIALRERPDLILMDVSLPDMNDIMATEKIREREPGQRTPIIVLSAHDSPPFPQR